MTKDRVQKPLLSLTWLLRFCHKVLVENLETANSSFLLKTEIMPGVTLLIEYLMSKLRF